MRVGRRGYVLVTVLGLLVLSTTLLVSMGRVAIQRTLGAREAQEELQRRWGQISAQRAVLPHAEQILVRLERRLERPVAAHRANVVLGGQNFELIVGDEQAKANVNALIDLADQERAEMRIRSALSGSGLGGQIKLRPSLVPASLPTTRPVILPRYISGFGQIFSLGDSAAPRNLIVSRGNAPAPAELMTLWGEGRLNIRRASAASLALLNSPPLTQIDISRLIEAQKRLYERNPRPQSPAATPGDSEPIRRMMGEAGIDRSRVNLHLMLGSRCHSLWIIVRDGRREWYSLTVREELTEAKWRVETFVW